MFPRLKQLVDDAGPRHSKLILLVGPPDCGKTTALETRRPSRCLRGVSMRDKARLGFDKRINFRDVVNVVSGLALGQHSCDLAPVFPAFSLLLTEINRKQTVGSALRWLAGARATRDAVAVLDALKMLPHRAGPAPAMPKRS